MGVAQSIANEVAGLQNVQSGLTGTVSLLQKDLQNQQPFTVSLARPRTVSFANLAAKLANTGGKTLWQAGIAAANATSYSLDRMVMCAILYATNCPSGFSYAKTAAQYGAQGLADLAAFVPTTPPNLSDGYEDSLGLAAIAYDLLQPLFAGTPQQTTIASAMQKIMDARTVSDPLSNRNWFGYNEKGGDGMCMAIATFGDLPAGTKDYAQDFFANNWNVVSSQSYFWNWQNVKTWQSDRGDNEGLGYYGTSQTSNWLTKAIFENATGSTYFKGLGFFENFPRWWLYNHEPGFPKYAGVSGNTWAWPLQTTRQMGGWDGSVAAQAFDMLRAATGLVPDAALAAWILQQNGGYAAHAHTPARGVVYGVLIGDPTVVPQSPTQLGLPLSYVSQSQGEAFFLSSWASDATVLEFGCTPYNCRTNQIGDVSLYKRCALTQHRDHIFNHGYCNPPTGDSSYGNNVVFFQGTKPVAYWGANNQPNTPGGKFTPNSDGTYTLDSKANYQGSTSLIGHVLRTIDPRDLTNVVVTDDVACDPSVTPHVCWQFYIPPTPGPSASLAGQPVAVASMGQVQIDALSVLGGDGVTMLSMQFSQPVNAVFIGGTTDFARNYDGTQGTNTNSDFPKWTSADQVHYAGFWRVHVLIPAGGGKLTTNLKVV